VGRVMSSAPPRAPSPSRSARWRAAVTALAGVSLVAVVFALVAGGSRAPSVVPASPALTLRPGQSTVEQIGVLQAAARSRPRNAEVLAGLGVAYYQRVRETGDFSYYVRAQGVLDHALRLQPDNLTATVGMATIALARHDFAGGLRYALRARSLNPLGVAGFAGVIDGQVETGRYREAAQSIQQFVDLRPGLPSYARVSYFRELHGDLTGAVDAMGYAISAGGETPENVAYVQTLLGDLQFLRGRVSEAKAAYRLALGGVGHYVPAQVGLAQVQAVQGHLPAAIGELRDAVTRLPLPQYIVALGEDELAAGRPAAARTDFALIGAEERLLEANGVNTDVDLALFEAGHGDPRRGLTLARRAWQRASSIRSADAMGWALTRAGNPLAGLVWARRALTLGSRDPFLLYHAGAAAAGAGQRTLAARYLRESLALNPRFSAYYAPLARRALRAVT